jgi:phospholipase C
MLPSARIANAPTLAQVLTLDVPREDKPDIAEPSGRFTHLSLSESLNDLQMILVAGNARRFGLDLHQVLAPMGTRAHAVEFLSRIVAHSMLTTEK